MRAAALLVAALFALRAEAGGLTLGQPAFVGSLLPPLPTVAITSPNSGNAHDVVESTSVTVSGTTTGAPADVKWKIGAGSETSCTVGSGTFSCNVTGLTANAAQTVTVTPYTGGAAAGTADTQAITRLAPCGAANAEVLYRAQSLGLANNDPVTTWTNLGTVASADAAQSGASTLKPTFLSSCINGEACIDFDGGDYLRTAAFTSNATPYTICFVTGVDTTTNSFIFDDDATASAVWCHLAGAGPAPRCGGSAGFTASTTVATGQWYTICSHVNGASSAIAVNGTSTTGTMGTTAHDAFTVGANQALTALMNGRIAALWRCDGDARADGKAYADADFGSTWPKAF